LSGPGPRIGGGWMKDQPSLLADKSEKEASQFLYQNGQKTNQMINKSKHQELIKKFDVLLEENTLNNMKKTEGKK
jgi:hypothetical protein